MIAELLDPNDMWISSEEVVWVPVLVTHNMTSNNDCRVHETSEALFWFRKDRLPSLWRRAIELDGQTNFVLDHTMRSKSSLRFFGKDACDESEQRMTPLEKEISNVFDPCLFDSEKNDVSSCPPLPFMVGSRPLSVTILETA